MGFDLKAFKRAKYQAREAFVSVPELGSFFDDGEKPGLTVRGLTGKELGIVNDFAAKNETALAIGAALLSQSGHEIKAALSKHMQDAETPENVSKRIKFLDIGLVSPDIQGPDRMDFILKFCRILPVDFWETTNKITELTGRGHVPGKLKSSGSGQESEQA